MCGILQQSTNDDDIWIGMHDRTQGTLGFGRPQSWHSSCLSVNSISRHNLSTDQFRHVWDAWATNNASGHQCGQWLKEEEVYEWLASVVVKPMPKREL